MELALIEPTDSAKSPNFKLLTNENYELTLSESIQSLLHEYRKGISEFSSFVSNFHELMQARVDPPLEAIWVYSALSFRSSNFIKDDALNRVSIAKDLFQLVSACSASCSSSKSVALLAPVVFEVYKLVLELLGKDLSLKRDKKVMKEVVSLIEVILGYISVCCSKKSREEDDDSVDLITSFADSVCLWVEGNGEGSEGLVSFLPLVSKEVCRELSEGGCDVSYLAGVVIAEAFLLRLCLNIWVGLPKAELENKLRNWAVGSITGFQNYYFFDTLVKMLLEPTLPINSLLNSEYEDLLRKVLYDAVILVEYSFLNPERVIQPPAKSMKSLAITRLIVTHEAIELFRKNGDQTRAISYINAFSGSRLPSQIIKWVTNQIGMEGKASGLNGSSPKALIQWLLDLEDQGIRIFDGSISKCRAKLLLDVSKANYKQLACEAKGKTLDADLFYIDKKGEEKDGDDEGKETNDSTSAAFVAAAHTMKLADNGGGRKRKEMISFEKKKPIKFLKYNLCDNSDSARQKLSPANNDGLSSESEVENPLSDEDTPANNDGLSSESEVENPLSDEDMEVKEQ